MSMFPGANAQVYYNEAGEPLGWDYPPDPDDPRDADDEDHMSAAEQQSEDAYDDGRYDAENDEPFRADYHKHPGIQAAYKQGYDENKGGDNDDAPAPDAHLDAYWEDRIGGGDVDFPDTEAW